MYEDDGEYWAVYPKQDPPFIIEVPRGTTDEEVMAYAYQNTESLSGIQMLGAVKARYKKPPTI